MKVTVTQQWTLPGAAMVVFALSYVFTWQHRPAWAVVCFLASCWILAGANKEPVSVDVEGSRR